MNAAISAEAAPSLIRVLDPQVLADPYPLHRQLREHAPVHWDAYLHSWVVTRYAEVAEVLTRFSAARTPGPDRLAELGMGELAPIASVMVRQMLFLDPPEHGRVRGLAHAAFTARRIEHLRDHIQEITDRLIDGVLAQGHMDVMAELANPLPAIVTAEMLGVPTEDHTLLKVWSEAFAEMLGNFQHNPGRTGNVLAQVAQMTDYFRAAVRAERTRPTKGLINALVNAEVDGDRFSEDDVIANIIVTMVGGQETTTNLIGNGILTLLRHPDQLQRLREDPSLMPSAVEELLRYESPSQHTARLAPADVRLGDCDIEQGQAVIAVMAAANRDPARFPDPDRLDLGRADNRHLAFGWAGHFCFGAPLARMEGASALATVLRRLPDLHLITDEVTWRPNLGLRGLQALDVAWGEPKARPASVPTAVERRKQTLADLTPAQRALVQQRLKGREPRSKAEPAPATPQVGGAPMTATAEQRQIVFHGYFAPGNPVYNEAAAIVHTGPLDVAALHRALQALIDRHESWRTTFSRRRRNLAMVVHDSVAVELPTHDLRRLPLVERNEELIRLVMDVTLEPYHLKEGPLLRALLVRMTDDEHRLYLALHHVAFDGVSLQRVALPDLVALYDAQASERPAALAPVVQYSRFAAWQLTDLPARLERELPYWREHLHDAPTLAMPLAHPRPAEPRHVGVPHWFDLPAELVAGLSRTAEAAGATLFHALVAGYARLLQAWGGQEDIVLSTVADSRKRQEFESVLGYCLTPVPLRLRFAPDLPARELIGMVRDEVLAALSHAIPFESLVDDLAPTAEPGAAPIFQTQIVLEPQSVLADPAWSLRQLDPVVGPAFTAAKNDIQIELDHRPEGHVIGRLIANADLFEPDFAERAVAQWVAELERLTAE